MPLHTGIKEITLSDKDLAAFYETKECPVELVQNEYLIIKDQSGDYIDKFRFNGERLVKLNYKRINNHIMGKIKPLNHEQEIIMDLCENNKITIKSILGIPGGGKTFLPVAIGIDKVLKGEFNKFIFIKNNVDIGHSPLGALPGTLEEKLSVWEYSLIDTFGDRMILEKLKSDNKLEVVHLGFTLGRTFNNSFILVDESSHLSKKHMYNLTTRVGYDSVMVFSGDIYQNYSSKYQNGNSGLTFLHEKLKGQDFFGCVHVTKSERSQTAQRCADLLFEGLKEDERK